MPAYLTGYLTCDGCQKTVASTAEPDFAYGKTEFTWKMLPGWILYDQGGAFTRVFCNTDCNKRLAVMGSPSQRGYETTSSGVQYDDRTMDKLVELILSARLGANADDILAAIEAVLTAWRKTS